MARDQEKTNVMRILDQHRVPYIPHCYAGTGALSGLEAAKALGQDPARIFKTLVTVARSGRNYVFVIPAEKELDLKKAAACVGEKAVEMLPQKALLPTTGYVHGGCSPIGMKKLFPTVFHETAEALDTLMFSAGKIGYQVELHLVDLKELLPYQLADLTK